MLSKKLALAVAGLLASGAVLADPPHWAPAHGWRAKHFAHQRHYYYAPRPVYYAPRPVVVMPPPRVVYTPAPVYYAPPPVVYPAPVPSSGVSIRLHFPL